MKYRYLFIMCAAFLWVGCNQEDDIEVKEGLEISYTLPQGDHDYDGEIVDWYEKFGFYTLYIYEKKDIYWANTGWEERLDSESQGGSLRAEAAEPDHVGKQLDLFKCAFMDLYPDSLIAQYMPLKVLLCSELWRTDWDIKWNWDTGEKIETLIFTKRWAYEGWDYVAINGGSQEIDTMGLVSKSEFQAAVNTIFLNRLNKKNGIEMSEEFISISDYTPRYLGVDQAFVCGFIDRTPCGDDVEAAKKDDFMAYLRLASMSIVQLEAIPDRRYDYDYNNNVSLVGAFHATRDVNGLVRKKYEVMIKILKEMGIDTDQFQYPEF